MHGVHISHLPGVHITYLAVAKVYMIISSPKESEMCTYVILYACI
jgi:hypothetical protein